MVWLSLLEGRVDGCRVNHTERVVVVHGRAAAMEIEGSFENRLTNALRFGLRRAGYDHWDCVPVSVPFYGQLWRPDEYLPLPVFDPGTSAEGISIHPGRLVEGAMEFADRFFNLSGGVLELMLTDVKEYFTRDALRTATDDLVRGAFGDAEKVVVVGFSMGSIVAYHVLVTESEGSKAIGLVTCGSPIASRSFYKYLSNLAPNGVPVFPAGVRIWANIWNNDDPATQVHDLASYFLSNRGRVVQSARTFGRPPEPWNPAAAHNSDDYLSSKALGAAVKTALVGR
jgi:pimeloyl-ACP methyl ester carboxylesterase